MLKKKEIKSRRKHGVQQNKRHSPRLHQLQSFHTEYLMGVWCSRWPTLLASALMTMPRLDRELLMAVISLKRSPWDWLFTIRSLPAKSTRQREATHEGGRRRRRKAKTHEIKNEINVTKPNLCCCFFFFCIDPVLLKRWNQPLKEHHTHIYISCPCQRSLLQYGAGRPSGSETSGRSGPSGPWSGSARPNQSDPEPEGSKASKCKLGAIEEKSEVWTNDWNK